MVLEPMRRHGSVYLGGWDLALVSSEVCLLALRMCANPSSLEFDCREAAARACTTAHRSPHCVFAAVCKQAPLEPQPQDLLRYPSEVPNMQQSSSIPKGPSPNGSLIAPLDVALGKDSQFLLNNRRDSQSSSVGSPDCNKPISRSRLEQPSAAPSGKQPLGGSRGGQFDLVEWGRQAEQGMLSKWEQQQQACKPRSRDSSVSTPSINLVEHAAHRRTSNTAQSSLLTDTARASRQDKDKGGAGDAGGGGVSVAAGDKAVRVRGVRRSSSCSDLENVSAATSRNDRGQVRDKVQGFDSGQLGQPPSGWCGNSGGPHGYNHIYNHVWQAQTIEEEALQDLEGSAGPVGQDAQKTSTDGRYDARARAHTHTHTHTHTSGHGFCMALASICGKLDAPCGTLPLAIHHLCSASIR
eukprot:1158310-Pelagomonas_calceolata.AAC.9